jgi:hypothetical protein
MPIVPPGADPEPRATAGEVQRGDLLSQDAGIALDRAGDQRHELRPFGVGGKGTERGVRL